MFRKRWILFPPEQTDHLYPTRVPFEESSVFSDVNITRPNLQKFPKLKVYIHAYSYVRCIFSAFPLLVLLVMWTIPSILLSTNCCQLFELKKSINGDLQSLPSVDIYSSYRERLHSDSFFNYMWLTLNNFY